MGRHGSPGNGKFCSPPVSGCILFLGWFALRNPPQAVLRDDGIEFRAFRAVIPWSEVVEAVPSRSHPVEYVRLRVRDPERYLQRLTPLQRYIGQTGEPEPNIGFVLTGAPNTAEELCRLIRERVRREPPSWDAVELGS